MLGSESEQLVLCTDLYLINTNVIVDVQTNGNSCTRVLNNNTLHRCLYEESSVGTPAACTTLITLQDTRHQ